MANKSTKSSTSLPSSETLDFETSVGELELMVEKMAKGQLSLEESLKNFEQGMSLARKCQQALKEAEQKVQILTSQDGSFKTSSFGDTEQ